MDTSVEKREQLFLEAQKLFKVAAGISFTSMVIWICTSAVDQLPGVSDTHMSEYLVFAGLFAISTFGLLLSE